MKNIKQYQTPTAMVIVKGDQDIIKTSLVVDDISFPKVPIGFDYYPED